MHLADMHNMNHQTQRSVDSMSRHVRNVKAAWNPYSHPQNKGFLGLLLMARGNRQVDDTPELGCV